MKRAYLLFIILLFHFSLSTKAQEGFRFFNQSKNRQRITFKLINNLIVIPLEINGKNLSFILDTGVNKTIIFSLLEKDRIGLLNPEKITLRGLGGGEPVAAILSKRNRIKIKGLVSGNEAIYVILKDFFDLLFVIHKCSISEIEKNLSDFLSKSPSPVKESLSWCCRG